MSQTKDELKHWRSQFVTSNSDLMGLRYSPFAFTEQGIAMLSSVLNSTRAIQVNIQIIRTFTKLRELVASHKDIIKKIEDMERKYDARHNNYDNQFKVIFEAIRQMLEPPAKSKKAIGFKREDND